MVIVLINFNKIKEKLKSTQKKLIEIFNDYKEEFIIMKPKIKEKILIIKNNIKNFIKDPNTKKQRTILSSIAIILTIFFFTKLISYGYYTDNSTLSLINTKVGDFDANKYDIVIRYYAKMLNNNTVYKVVDKEPDAGYEYTGYKCKNNSTLSYNIETKEVSLTTDKKEICSLYFDNTISSDITLEFLIETSPNTKEYTLTEKLPLYGYTYDKYTCENNSTLIYDETTQKFKISANKKDKCKVYYNKLTADININIYAIKNNSYVQITTIPEGNTYKINSDKTICKNMSNEKVDAKVTYTNKIINIDTKEKIICDVYLSDANET